MVVRLLRPELVNDRAAAECFWQRPVRQCAGERRQENVFWTAALIPTRAVLASSAALHADGQRQLHRSRCPTSPPRPVPNGRQELEAFFDSVTAEAMRQWQEPGAVILLVQGSRNCARRAKSNWRRICLAPEPRADQTAIRSLRPSEGSGGIRRAVASGAIVARHGCTQVRPTT